MTLPSSRIIHLIVFGGCAFLMSVALFMQYVMELEPCPMCILQRGAVIVIGMIALVAAIHGPKETGIRIYAGLIVLWAVIGGGISIRHLWLQSLPEDQVPACGPGLDYMLDVFPLTEVLSLILQGDGTCAEVLWSFLGLSIPGWTLVGFVGLGAIGVYQFVAPKTARPQT